MPTTSTTSRRRCRSGWDSRCARGPMIQINLLPVREAKRKADVKQNVLELVFALILVAAAIGFFQSDLSAKIQTSQNRITQMQNDIEKFKPQLDQVAAFRAKKAELQK